MKILIKLLVPVVTLAIAGCATSDQAKSIDQQLLVAVPCPVGFKPQTSYSTTIYSADKDKKEPTAKVSTECVPEELNTDPDMEWR